MPLHAFTKLFPQTYQCWWFTKRTEVIHDTPDSLQQIQDTPFQNTGYRHRLDSQRTKSCKPSTYMMVHSRHTRTSNSQTPIMCQTWHCGTQLCSQPPEEEVGAAEETQLNAEKSTKILKTSNLHPSTQKKISSRHIHTDLKELAISQVHITSPYVVIAKPIIHAPRKCPIAMWPLVWEKLDQFME